MELFSAIRVWDNEGETADRYTILNMATGDVFGCSENPFDMMGFAQYSHTTDHAKATEIVYNLSTSNVGKPIDLFALPTDVRKYIVTYVI